MTKRIAPFAFLAIFIGLGQSVSHAKTIYVSPAGRDGDPGTINRPVASPGRGVGMAESGDTVCFRAGRYDIAHFIWVNMPNITIASYPGELAMIAEPTDDVGGFQAVFIIVASNVSLVGLDITGGAYYGIKIDVENDRPTTGVSIRKCRIHHTGCDSIKTFNADNLLIEDCEIGPSGVRDSSNAEGIDSIGSIGATIRRCYIHDTATNGVYLKGGARDGVIENCRIENTNGFSGILLGQDTDRAYMREHAKYEAMNCVARNNLVTHTGAAGVGTYSGYDIRFENNTLYEVANEGQAGLWVVTNSARVPAEKVVFKNNIVVMSSARPFAFVQNLADHLDCDANIYYSTREAYIFTREVRGQSSQYKFADWKQTMQTDERSFLIDPMLDASDLYRPLKDSPAIDHGLRLAEVATDYSGIARPQGFGYDIGAHEQIAGAPAHASRSQDRVVPRESTSRTGSRPAKTGPQP